VRGRLGYAYDRALIYFTGGFAYGESHGVASIVLGEGGGFRKFSFNPSADRTGCVLGGGVEYALTSAWSLKGEYQFIDLGSSDGFVFFRDGSI
jgi:outer membrane immunogenic protein